MIEILLCTESHGLLWASERQTDSHLWMCVHGSGTNFLNIFIKYNTYMWFRLRPWAYRLKKKMTPSIRKRVKKSKAMVKKYIDKNGKKRVYRTQKLCSLNNRSHEHTNSELSEQELCCLAGTVDSGVGIRMCSSVHKFIPKVMGKPYANTTRPGWFPGKIPKSDVLTLFLKSCFSYQMDQVSTS